jgi:hypothetical protein
MLLQAAENSSTGECSKQQQMAGSHVSSAARGLHRELQAAIGGSYR